MVGWPQGIAPPGLPQIRTCGIPGSGSSVHGLAARAMYDVDVDPEALSNSLGF